MARGTVAIMQPTYLPWLGYFDLMDQCDTFVLLDSVQFDRRSWQQRNRVKTPQGELWLTVPVRSKGRRESKISEVEIDRSQRFEETHIRTFEHFYAKAPFYRDSIDELAAILRKGHTHLAELTIELIGWLRERLGLEGELVRSSTLGVEGKKVELLVAICQRLGADRYISPPGAREYIEEDNLFPEHGIELCYHAYRHSEYRQLHGPFVPQLSVVDLLLNEGASSLAIIRSGRVAPE